MKLATDVVLGQFYEKIWLLVAPLGGAEFVTIIVTILVTLFFRSSQTLLFNKLTSDT
jgi:hypothetical protein